MEKAFLRQDYEKRNSMKNKLEQETRKKFSAFTIHCQKTIREAFKKQSLNKEDFVIAVDDDEKVVGVVTDGDFRRAIWNSVALEKPLETITNKNFTYFEEDYDPNKVKEIFATTGIRQIPILCGRMLVDIIFKSQFKAVEVKPSKKKLDVPVVIMAGGAGTRLDPFTRILPKPLIPIGEKPVIEVIMDKFAAQGVNRFYISVNHKAKIIKAFFEEFDAKCDISYLEEEEPL